MLKDRIDLYKQIEAKRESKLLVYVTSTRGGLETQIANENPVTAKLALFNPNDRD